MRQFLYHCVGPCAYFLRWQVKVSYTEEDKCRFILQNHKNGKLLVIEVKIEKKGVEKFTGC
jgi:hypothetical protein